MGGDAKAKARKIDSRLFDLYDDYAMRGDFKAALEAAGAEFEMHTYPGTRHGFHNNSTPRYAEEAAGLAWERTIAFFDEHLS